MYYKNLELTIQEMKVYCLMDSQYYTSWVTSQKEIEDELFIVTTQTSRGHNGKMLTKGNKWRLSPLSPQLRLPSIYGLSPMRGDPIRMEQK